MMPSFSSPPFNDLTTTTATNAAPADNTEAPAKDGTQEEAAGGTTGADVLFNALATADGGGGSSSSSSTSLKKIQSQQ